MKITEEMLLDNYVGITNGLDLISEIGGEQFFWNYRKGRDLEGYNVVTHERSEAAEITLEYTRAYATIELNPCCEEHPALLKIRSAFSRICGDEAVSEGGAPQ